MSSHNERIAAKRDKSCMEFVQTTSTNMSTAKHYLQQSAFDLERAVSMFYDTGGEALPSDEEDEEEVVPSATALERNGNDNENVENDVISSIVNAAKEATPQASSSPSFNGKGFSLNSSRTNRTNDDPSIVIKVRVVFYKDGFTVQEVKSDEEKDSSTSQNRGIHTFSSAKISQSSLLPSVRKYEENQQFIQDVKQNRVPIEFRRLDSQRRPIPVSIELGDLRTREYPKEEYEKQRQRQDQLANTNPFNGTGKALGGRGESNAPSIDQPNNNNNHVWIFALLLSLWGIFLTFVTNLFRRAIPLQKHIVDHEKPTTTIALRMPSNKRERVEFNVDHTVEDLRRYCQIELDSNNATSSISFELMAGFPPKMIPINKDTLKDAGLINSAIEVRILASHGRKRSD